jgi:uncharacterized protein YndB with AHSA1/START domain
MTFDIVHSVDIETTPDRLYEALTTQQGHPRLVDAPAEG